MNAQYARATHPTLTAIYSEDAATVSHMDFTAKDMEKQSN
jgi:hypothetical protein